MQRRTAPLAVLALVLAGCAAPVPPGDGDGVGPTDKGRDRPGPGEPPRGTASWPQYQLNVTGTRLQSGEHALTRDTIGQLRPLWNVTVGAALTGTPIVAGGRVIVGAWDGTLHAFDARTGQRQWEVALEGGVTNTAAIDGEALYVGDAKGWLYRLDAATGQQRWRTATDPEPATHLYGSPLVHDGVIYIGVASDQHSVRLYPEPDPLTFRGSIIAVDASNGQIKWRTPTQRPEDGLGGSVWSTPALDVASSTLFIGTGQAYTAPDGPRVDAMMALDARTGEPRWVFKATEDDVWTQRKPEAPDWDFGSSPVLVRGEGGRLLVVEAQKSSVVWARDAASGEAVWQLGEPRGGGDILASPAVMDGMLYLPTISDRDVKAIDAATGALRWNASLGSGAWSAPAALPGGVVLVGTGDGFLVALHSGTGAELGRWPTGRGGIFGGVSVADGIVYTATVPSGFLGDEGALIAWGLG